MKTKRFLIAALLVATIASVAVVSCKKETPEAMQQNVNETQTVFSPENITDMNAYLKGFKKQMQESKGGETMSLDEAAWHLSSLANYDFANANAKFNDLRFDTIYYQMNVNNGRVSICDLNLAYHCIGEEIDAFYHSLNLDEKHFHFIGASINAEGTVVMSMMTTFMRSSKNLGDNLWYYDNLWDLGVDCSNFFDGCPALPAPTLGRSELERYLNWKISHTTPETRYYYTVSSVDEFYYRDEIDPFGSPYYLNSRLYANHGMPNVDILPYICYLCDSSLGLGCDNCPNGKYIIYWKVLYELEYPFSEYHERFMKEHYRLLVAYGDRHAYPGEPGGNDY